MHQGVASYRGDKTAGSYLPDSISYELLTGGRMTDKELSERWLQYQRKLWAPRKVRIGLTIEDVVATRGKRPRFEMREDRHGKTGRVNRPS